MRLNPDGTWTTYRRADGEDMGEYAWTDSLPEDEEADLIAETWTLVKTETIPYVPYFDEVDDE